MSQALYRKWRPHLWDEVVGQPHIIQTLRNTVAAGRIAHAYLFAGPRGTGKTTTARLLAKAANCLAETLADRPCDQCDYCQAVNQGRFLDLIEIDAASNTSVEDVRSLRDKINFKPNQARFKVYIIDEVHMLSTAAFNALLKTLEEPPPHAIFILATTEIHKIPATVLSRCQRHEFRRIPLNDIIQVLQGIVRAEGIPADPEALMSIARQATGAMRDAISLLDQLASSGQKITLDMAQSVLGITDNQALVKLVDAVLQRSPTDGLSLIQNILDSGTDPRQLARQVVEYLRGMMLVRSSNSELVDATKETIIQMARQAQELEAPHLLRMVRAFNQAATEARLSWQPSLLLELALMESLQEEPSTGSELSVSKKQAIVVRKPTQVSPTKQPPANDANEVGGEVEAGLTVKMVSDQWHHIRTALKRMNASTEGLLNSGRLMGVKNGTVYLGFHEVLKMKMEQDENISLVKKAFQQVLNTEVPIMCVIYTGKPGSLPPDVDGDGMVATALRDLGGEIVDVQ